MLRRWRWWSLFHLFKVLFGANTEFKVWLWNYFVEHVKIIWDIEMLTWTKFYAALWYNMNHDGFHPWWVFFSLSLARVLCRYWVNVLSCIYSHSSFGSFLCGLYSPKRTLIIHLTCSAVISDIYYIHDISAEITLTQISSLFLIIQLNLILILFNKSTMIGWCQIITLYINEWIYIELVGKSEDRVSEWSEQRINFWMRYFTQTCYGMATDENVQIFKCASKDWEVGEFNAFTIPKD